MQQELKTLDFQPLQAETFRIRDLSAWSEELPARMKSSVIVALATLLFVFGFGGVWSATAKLGGAVIGHGRVIAESQNIVIQHLEGGIIDKILVKVGQEVKAGQPLALIDGTRIRSELYAAQVKLALLNIALVRYRAQGNQEDQFVIDPQLIEPVKSDPKVVGGLVSQKAELKASADVLNQKKLILQSKIKSNREELISLNQAVVSYDKQNSLIKDEHDALSFLLKKKLTNVSRVLALERAMAQIDSQRANAEYETQKANHDIVSFQEQIEQLRVESLEDANKNIVDTQQNINATDDVVRRLKDQLAHTVLRAPKDGIVFQLYKTSVGSVLSPGEKFAEIFPLGEKLTIETNVSPDDIREVSMGQPVDVVFQSDQRDGLTPLSGAVTYISTDTIVDDKTRAVSYIVRVSIEKTEGRKVLPGNVAEVYFKTEPKTLVEYLAEPVTQFRFRAFKG
jgi:HlyD family type I secretion membrane fusion protein